MMSSPELLLPTTYVMDATKQIKRAKKRVCLLSTIIVADDSTNDLIKALSEAAKRGVSVEVAADIFTYGELVGFFFPGGRYRSKLTRATTQMSQYLIKSGVKFSWVGKSRTTIFNGNTHMKWCVVDDTVYSFGGVNLYQKGIEKNNDYVFKLKDKALADKLIDEYNHLIQADAGNCSYPSHSLKHGDDQILIDGGFIGDSIIYRHACKLAAEASKVVLVSQYCPTGKLSRLLKATNSKLYFNPPSSATLLNRAVINVGMFFSGHKTLYTKPRYLHAKFIIFYMPGGRRVALTGSHNFVKGGVFLGAREIALQTENPQTIKQLEDFYHKYIA